jgi:uncharacterized protein
MEEKIPPNANVDERDPAAPEAGTARPAHESAFNTASEAGGAPDAEPETLPANEGGTTLSSSVEREPEREALTPPEGTAPGVQLAFPPAYEVTIDLTRPESAPPAPQPVVWKGLDVLLFLLFSAIWLFLSQLLSLAGYAALRPLMGWRTPASALVLNENATFVVAAQLVFYAPVLLYIFLVVVLQYHQAFGVGIRWRWPSFRQGVRFLLAGLLLAMVVLAGSAILPDRKDFPMEKLFTSPSAVYAVGGLAVLVAPFMEELVFRGVLFSFFERLGGFRTAVPATAVLFAALHYPEYAGAWTHVFMILVVGLVLSVARAATGSLVPSFLLHTAYNATFIGLLFLGTHGFQNLHGTLDAP